MFNDYGLADIAWQRQREAERAAAAHRLVALAQLGTKAALDKAGRLSLAARVVPRVVHRIGQMMGVAVKDLGRLPEYAAKAERLHPEIRTSGREATKGPRGQGTK